MWIDTFLVKLFTLGSKLAAGNIPVDQSVEHQRDWVAYGISGFALIIAILALYLNWRHRPLRTESIELHSKELKEVIRGWIATLDLPDVPTKSATAASADTYVTQIPTPSPYSHPVERNALFQDLKNHLPQLMDDWELYKAARDRYL